MKRIGDAHHFTTFSGGVDPNDQQTGVVGRACLLRKQKRRIPTIRKRERNAGVRSAKVSKGIMGDPARGQEAKAELKHGVCRG
jgi:hypothetical protein